MEDMIKFELTKDEAYMLRSACNIAREHFGNLYQMYNRDSMKEREALYKELYHKIGDITYGKN